MAGPTLRQVWTGLRILHGALLGSIAIYGVMVVVVIGGQQNQPRAQPASDPKLLAAALGAAALMDLVMIAVLRKRLMPKQAIEDDGRRTDLANEAPPGFLAVLPKLRSALIVTWALCEAIAIFGLVVAFVSLDMRYFAPFAVVGAGAMIYYAPTRKLLESVLRANR